LRSLTSSWIVLRLDPGWPHPFLRIQGMVLSVSLTGITNEEYGKISKPEE
jgi:hypothetical protein